MSSPVQQAAASSARRHFIRAAVALCAVAAAGAAQPALSLSNALNRSARCRSLALRCAKLHGQLHLAVLPDASRDLLEASQRQLRSEVQHIGQAGLSGAPGAALASLHKEVDALVAGSSLEPSRASVMAVAQQSDHTYAAADHLVEALQAASKQSQARLIEVAARVRGRSQRLARNHFLIAAGHDHKALREQMQADRRDFARALEELDRAPLSTPAIRNELGLVHTQWTFFDAALGHPVEAEGLRDVATTSERIHEVGDSLTALYDAALQDLLGHAS